MDATANDSLSGWLRFLLGLEAGEVPGGADSRLELTGILHGPAAWFGVLILAASIALVILLYLKERDLSRWQRTLLGALRLGALAIVVWMLLDPRLLTVIQLKRDAHTLVLLDVSGSMGQEDKLDAKERRGLERAAGLDLDSPRPRAAIALAAIEHQRLIERLGEKNKVRSYVFDTEARAVDAFEPASFQPPGGEETRLGDALRGVLKSAGPDPLAGIVIVSDGRSTGGEPLEKAAAEVSLRAVPVYAVAVGRGREPVNYAVSELTAPEMAHAGFPIRIQGRVEVSGLRGPVTATLHRQPVKGGQKEKVDEKKVEGRGTKFSAAVVFVDTLPANGTYRYTLSLPRHSEEIELADNSAEAQVTAADEKCRVLLLAGGPSMEYQFLRAFLIRDDGLQVSCWLATAEPGYPQDGDVVIRELPDSLEDLRPYDVVVLLDPSRKVLTPALAGALPPFVLEQGGGLCFVAGEYHTGEFFTSAACAEVRALLPVEPPEGGGSAARLYTHAWRPALTRQGMDHPLCRLVDDPEENLRLWAQIPGFYYSARVRGLKPTATALLQREDGEVIAAAQKAGAGYSIFLGTDDFKCLRSLSWKKGFHERFWGAIVRYLAIGKKISGAGEASLTTDRDRYALGDEIVVEASLTDPERKPLVKDRVQVAVDLVPHGGASGVPDSSSTSLRLNLLPVQGRPGWYLGRFRPDKVGEYGARVDGSAVGGKASFLVVSPSTEWEDPAPDHAALEDLARRTGGEFFRLEDIGDVPGRIPDRGVTEVIGRSASAIWDSSALMLLFSALLVVEWVLRKLWRLN